MSGNQLVDAGSNAMEIATVAESFTRKLVEVEKDRINWMQECVKCGKERNEALDRARDAEAALGKARERIAELEAEVAMHESFDGVSPQVIHRPEEKVIGRAKIATPDAPETCPHAEGTREWAIWCMVRGGSVQNKSGAPWRRVNGEYESFNGSRWVKCEDAISNPLWTIGDPACHTGWRVLTDAQVAALEAGQ